MTISEDAKTLRNKYYRSLLDGIVGDKDVKGNPIRDLAFLENCRSVAKLSEGLDSSAKEIVFAVFQHCDYNDKGMKSLFDSGFIKRLKEILSGVYTTTEVVQKTSSYKDPLYGE